MKDRDSSFLSYIGPATLGFDGEVGDIELLAEPRHTNITGRVHGGVLMTLADSLLGRTGFLAAGVQSSATISLSVDFVGPAKVGDLIRGRARLIRRAGDILALKGDLRVDDRVILTADGLWKVLRPGRRAPDQASGGARGLPSGFAEMDLLDPFERHVGPFYELREENGSSYAVRALPHHANPFGRTHGGLLMTFADAAMGDHVSRLVGGWGFVTVSQVTNFLGTVPTGAVLEVKPALISRTDSLLVTEGHFHCQGELAMTARSLWKLAPPRPS